MDESVSGGVGKEKLTMKTETLRVEAGEKTLDRLRSALRDMDVDESDEVEVAEVKLQYSTAEECSEREDATVSVAAASTVDGAATVKTGSGKDETSGGQTITESDRKYGDISPGSNMHTVLEAIVDIGGRVTNKDLIESTGMESQQVTPATSKMYRRRILEREMAGDRFEYWVSEHGRSVLRDLR